MDISKFIKAVKQLDIFLYFGMGLVMIQALAITGGFTFDSVVPYMVLLIIISFWQEKPVIKKKIVFLNVILSLVYVALYLLGEYDFLKGAIVFAGGFLAACYFYCKIKEFRVNKQAVIGTSLLIILIFFNLIQEGFIGITGQRLSGLISLVMILGVLYLGLYNTISRIVQSRKISGYNVAGAFLFAVFATLGHMSVFEGRLADYKITTSFAASVLIAFLCWISLFYVCFEEFYNIINRISFKRSQEKGGDCRVRPFWVGVVSFFVIVMCYIPFFLRYYPGIIEYDSWMQMVQVLGAPYSNHHPWLHTMIIKAIYETGVFLFHSANRAIALYSCFSISLLAFSFSCVIGYLYSKKVKVKFLIFLLAAYALSPINGIYSVIMWKDIPFAAVCLLFLLLLVYMKDKGTEGKLRFFHWMLFVVLSFMVCFLRTNGFYAYLLLIPFVIYSFHSKKIQAVVSIGLVLALAVIYKGPVFNHFGVTEPDTIESLSVPAQQVAAVIAYGGKVSEEQKELLEDIVSLEDVPEAYLGSVHCSDSIKDLVRLKGEQEQISRNKFAYLNLWFQMGLQNKYIYVKAFIDETSGYWYHKITYPFIWVTYVMENGSGINRECKVSPALEQKISDYMENYKEHFWKYYSNGLFTYLLFLCFITAMRNGSRNLVIYLWNLGIWLTLIIATPVYADFRYAYAIFLAVPFLIYITIADVPEERKAIKQLH